jgi:hypothetical protein
MNDYFFLAPQSPLTTHPLTHFQIFNQHGSAIWHVADYMSKQFERLYHAWVLDFRDRYLRWANPAARPWEQSCRACDGACKTQDSLMVLCDHCDAMYGIGCEFSYCIDTLIIQQYFISLNHLLIVRS